MKFRRCEFKWAVTAGLKQEDNEYVWLPGRFWGFGIQDGTTVALVENQYGEMLMRRLNQVQFPEWKKAEGGK